MIKIFKYPLQVTDQQIIKIPLGARFLCVQIQNGQPHLWAMVDIKMPNMEYAIYTIGTGHDAEHCQKREYIGTYQLQGGALIFHVFI